MHAPTSYAVRRKIDVQERRERAVKLTAQGWTQAEIADHFGVRPETIHDDLKIVRQRGAALLREYGRQELVAGELARLDEIDRAAWREFKRSRRPAKTRRVETDAAGLPVKTVEITEGRIGDSRLLAIASRTVEQRRQLLGLDAPAAQPEDADADGADAVVIEVSTRGDAAAVMRAGDARIAVRLSREEPSGAAPSAVTVDAVSRPPSAVTPAGAPALPSNLASDSPLPTPQDTPGADAPPGDAPDAPFSLSPGGDSASINERKQTPKRKPRKRKPKADND